MPEKRERVISSGDKLTIETVAAFAQLIRKELSEASTVVLEFSEGVEMDITALQLLCSACKTATAEGKKFAYRGPLPELLQELAPVTGPKNSESCNDGTISYFRQFEGV